MATPATTTRSSSNSIPQCCCGSTDCAFLAHNGKLLEGLERDVSKAAQLGQALLIRHETYVADSERERNQMQKAIDDLEKEKLQLEEKNAQTIKANRDLLDELERLNDAVAASDAHVQALTQTLHSTEEELQRLSTLANKTSLLERQLIDLEREQSLIQSSLESKTADERSALQRWKRAEQTIVNLQDQIDRIEKEAREEAERHLEIVARMERRMVVDGELATTAGRFRAKQGQEKGGSSVVSHFVKDILMDNANLQHGIVELREMLLNSNEEVERLRDQLRVHQPLTTPPAIEEGVETPTLQKELGPESVYNQELHIHHHYHGQAPPKSTPRSKPQRRSRNKRFSINPTYFPPIQPDAGAQAAIMSQTAVTVPTNNRWSNATTLAPSLPGSPVSVSHRDSIYDRVFSDVPYDSSRPTSPSDSIDLQSPMFAPTSEIFAQGSVYHKRKKSHSLRPPTLSTIRSASTPLSITAKSSPATAIISAVSPANSLANDTLNLSPSVAAQPAIPEENDEDSLLASPSPNPSPNPPDEDPYDLISPMNLSRPQTLRRAASHESLISISGMDIHTLQSRPSQLLLSSSPRFATPGGASSIQPELTPWTATATAGMSRAGMDSSTYNRSLLYSRLASSKRNAGTGNPPNSADSTPRNLRQPSAGLTTKIGGWVMGKWGAAPTPSTTNTTSATNSPAIPAAVINDNTTLTPTPPSTSTDDNTTPASTVRITQSNLATPSHSPSPRLLSPHISLQRPESSASAQTTSTASTSTSTPSSSSQKTPANSKKEKEKERMRLRPAGVNQSGPIWGFFDIPETPSKIVVTEEDVDLGALGDALKESSVEQGT
ncbi:unnamed protein product [Periconia digitata]|uniref:Uncharacterized protein n=1 Tax=Periconia digitata TaxID=1303443 RepID=A0A9W4U3W1_9PLEO|nr:unnamed protein product [Periconia digitata]